MSEFKKTWHLFRDIFNEKQNRRMSYRYYTGNKSLRIGFERWNASMIHLFLSERFHILWFAQEGDEDPTCVFN